MSSIARSVNRLCADVWLRVEMMQLARVNHVQPADGLKPWHDLFCKRLHARSVSLPACKIQIEVLAHEAVREACETPERILDAVAKEALAQQLVIEGHAKRKLCVGQ